MPASGSDLRHTSASALGPRRAGRDGADRSIVGTANSTEHRENAETIRFTPGACAWLRILGTCARSLGS